MADFPTVPSLAPVTVRAKPLPSISPQSSYGQRLLRVKLILPTANFPGTSSNTLTLVGYRVSATVQQTGNFLPTLLLTIYGMRQADMNQVTILYSSATTQTVVTDALVTVEASPDGAAWTQVFSGTFVQASPDYRQLPDACLRVAAVTGNAAQIQLAPPTSYRGATSIASIAQYLAGKMGFAFENNGVTGNLASPYYPGTYMDQFKQLAKHAGFTFYFDGNATLAICPANTPRQNKAKPVFTPASGLIGFPSIQAYGCHADVLFTPAVTVGAEIEIADSGVPGANGRWYPYSITHNLESLTPGGAWFSGMDCAPSRIFAAT